MYICFSYSDASTSNWIDARFKTFRHISEWDFEWGCRNHLTYKAGTACYIWRNFYFFVTKMLNLIRSANKYIIEGCIERMYLKNGKLFILVCISYNFRHMEIGVSRFWEQESMFDIYSPEV